MSESCTLLLTNALSEKGPGHLSPGWPRCCAPSRCEGTQVPLGLQAVRSHFPEHREVPAELELQCPAAVAAVPGCTLHTATATPFGVLCVQLLWFPLGLAQLSAVFLLFSEVQNSIVCSFQCVEEIGCGLFSLPQMKKLPS